MARPGKIAELSWMLTIASLMVFVAALYLAKGVLVPFTLATLLSFILSPVCDWLERRRLARVPAVLTTATVGFSLLGIVVWVAAVQMSHLAPKIPEYRTNIEAKLSSVNQYAVAALGKMSSSAQDIGENLESAPKVGEPRGTLELPYSVRVLTTPTSPLQVFGTLFGTMLEVLGTTGIVIVLVVFFLFRREDLRDRFIHLIGHGHVTVTTQMLEDASSRVTRYLSTLCLLNIAFGISVGVGLYLIGLPNAILWGILAATLRFIPYIGPWVSAVAPIALSMAISTGWGATIMTVVLFLVLELFNNNFLEPWLYGKNTGVSAVAVLAAAVFWAWLWGPVGLLLATPLTVCVLVVGKHIPQLSFLDILLGTEPVFEPKMRIYQRLLAGDQEEAGELLDEYLKDRPVAEVYDAVLIPALAMAETHWQLGELHDNKHKFVMQSLKEMIQERGERQQELLSKEETANAPTVDKDSSGVDEADSHRMSILCLPARTEADEITAMMLAQLVETRGALVQAVAVTSLAGGMDDILGKSAVDVVCISATPPAAVMHARHLCRPLRARYPNVKLVVGLWDAQGDLSKARDRIGCGAIVVATLAEAQAQIGLLTQAFLPATRLQARSPQPPGSRLVAPVAQVVSV